MATSEYVTAEQIAAELGVHIQTAQRYFREHGLRGRKVGGSWTTTRAAFDAWLLGNLPADDGAAAAAFGPNETPTGLPPLETK